MTFSVSDEDLADLARLLETAGHETTMASDGELPRGKRGDELQQLFNEANLVAERDLTGKAIHEFTSVRAVLV